jgi:BASS family bile acid:Na+ symporter
MKLWPEPDEVQQILAGLALVASMPIAGASTAWAQNANGNLTLSLGLILLTTLSSPILTPLVLHAGGFITTGHYSEDLHELASSGADLFLGVWVILPSLLGMLAHRILGERRSNAISPYLKLANFIVLALLNYSNASLTLPGVIAQPDFDFVIVMLIIVFLLCFVMFGAGYFLARVLRAGRAEMASMMFGLGMNNNGAGLVMASLAFSDHPNVMLPIIFYNLIQHFMAALVDKFLSWGLTDGSE